MNSKSKPSKTGHKCEPAEKTYVVPEAMLLALMDAVVCRPYHEVYRVVQDVTQLVNEQNKSKIQTL